MSNDAEDAEERVNKREYISRVAKRAGVPVRVASLIYDAGVEELLGIVGGGGNLTLTGLGRFYPQAHKGHRVRVKFGDGEAGEAAEVPDYAVLKFSATSSVNQKIDISKVKAKTKPNPVKPRRGEAESETE